MERMSRRALTPGEIAMARAAFGAGIDYARVRISHGAGGNPVAWLAFRNGNPAIALIRTIFLRDPPPPDFATGGDAPLLLHEMTHVWQYRRLGVARFYLRYARELAARRFRAAAMYAYAPGETRFANAMLEAQASMVEDYARALHSGDSPVLAKLARNLAGSGLYGL